MTGVQTCALPNLGNGTFVFPSGVFGNSYYIVVKHRNSLETWSATPVTFNAAIISYSFTDDSAKAFGNKLKNVGNGNYALYSGDVDQNGAINSEDFLAIKSATRFFPSGYLTNDVNGDYLVESSDYSIVENNSIQSISLSKP